jgi:hypothetical protein
MKTLKYEEVYHTEYRGLAEAQANVGRLGVHYPHPGC